MSAHIRRALLILGARDDEYGERGQPRAGEAAWPTKDWDKRFPKSFVTSDHVIEEASKAVIGERAH